MISILFFYRISPQQDKKKMSSDDLIWHLAEGITCHTWNKDRTKVAICPNTNEIWIFNNCQDPDVNKWRKEAILTEVIIIQM
jgi:actin related protein 2/3 complex subunit 1A/1B